MIYNSDKKKKKYKRACIKCDIVYPTSHKYSKKCPKCRIPAKERQKS